MNKTIITALIMSVIFFSCTKEELPKPQIPVEDKPIDMGYNELLDDK